MATTTQPMSLALFEDPVLQKGSGTAVIEGDYLELRTSGAGGYADRIVVVEKSPVRASFVRRQLVRFDSDAELYANVHWWGDGQAADQSSGRMVSSHFVQVQTAYNPRVALHRTVDSANTQLAGSNTPVPTAGTVYELEVDANADTGRIQVWLYPQGATRPAAPLIDHTTTGTRRSGLFGYAIEGGDPAVVHQAAFGPATTTTPGDAAETVLWADYGDGAGVPPARLYDRVGVVKGTGTVSYTGTGLARLDLTSGAYDSGAVLRPAWTGTQPHLRHRLAVQLSDPAEKFDTLQLRSSGTPRYSDGTQYVDRDCYVVSWRPHNATLVLERLDAETYVELANVPLPGTWAAGDYLELTVDSIVSDTAVTTRVRVWERGEAEPTTWALDHADTSANRKTGGRAQLSHGAGNSPSRTDVDAWTILAVTEAPTEPEPTTVVETQVWLDECNAAAGAPPADLYSSAVVTRGSGSVAYTGDGYLRQHLTTGAYDSGTRLRVNWSGTPAHLRVRMSLRLVDLLESYDALLLRASGIPLWGDPTHNIDEDSYVLSPRPQQQRLVLERRDGVAAVVLADVPLAGLAAGDHLELVADSIRLANSVVTRCRAWKRGTPEPTGWTLSYTDSSAERKDGSRLSWTHGTGQQPSTVDLDRMAVYTVTGDTTAGTDPTTPTVTAGASGLYVLDSDGTTLLPVGLSLVPF